jgi:hypothetical protein
MHKRIVVENIEEKMKKLEQSILEDGPEKVIYLPEADPAAFSSTDIEAPINGYSLPTFYTSHEVIEVANDQGVELTLEQAIHLARIANGQPSDLSFPDSHEGLESPGLQVLGVMRALATKRPS